jgi:hypothetical protein
MKRKKTVSFRGASGRKVRVTVEVDGGWSLSRDETSNIVEQIASGVMAHLPTVRYLNAFLSKVRVS